MVLLSVCWQQFSSNLMMINASTFEMIKLKNYEKTHSTFNDNRNIILLF